MVLQRCSPISPPSGWRSELSCWLPLPPPFFLLNYQLHNRSAAAAAAAHDAVAGHAHHCCCCYCCCCCSITLSGSSHPFCIMRRHHTCTACSDVVVKNTCSACAHGLLLHCEVSQEQQLVYQRCRHSGVRMNLCRLLTRRLSA